MEIVSDPGTASASPQQDTQELSRRLRKVLRRELPDRVFRPNPRGLIYISAQWIVIALSLAAMRRATNPLAIGALSLLLGHCMWCLMAAGHSLSHGSMVRNRYVRYIAEILTWTPVFASATAWTAMHNQGHHAHTNTTEDQYLYRYFTAAEQEQRLGARLYSFFFHPNRLLKWNPLILLPPVAFTLFDTFNAIFGVPLPASPEPQFEWKPRNWERVRVAFEFVLMIAYQLMVFGIVGPAKGLLAGIIPSILGLMIGMIYINTQHHLHPLVNDNDPLGSSTSLRLPKFIDFLHLHTSHHIEHHLFPAVDPAFFPTVCKALRRHFPGYHQVGLLEAYRELFTQSPAGRNVISDEEARRARQARLRHAGAA